MSLLLLAACSTTEKPLVVTPKSVVTLVPDSLLEACRKKKRQPPAAKVGVIVDRLRYTEAALAECGARIEAIRSWKDRQRGVAGKGNSPAR